MKNFLFPFWKHKLFAKQNKRNRNDEAVTHFCKDYIYGLRPQVHFVLLPQGWDITHLV